jgi:hypothetical protein
MLNILFSVYCFIDHCLSLWFLLSFGPCIVCLISICTIVLLFSEWDMCILSCTGSMSAVKLRGHHWKRWERRLFKQLTVVLGCFALQDKHNIRTYGKYKMHLHSLRNRTEKLAKGSPFYLFIYLVQINYIFSNNLCILSIYYIS